MPSRRWRQIFALLLFSALPFYSAMAVSTENEVFDLKIESQPLAAALQEFAKQSGIQVIFFSQVTEGLNAPAVHGRLTASAALQKLLDDSKLTYREINPKTIEIRPLAAVNSLVSGNAMADGAAATVDDKREGKTDSSDGFRVAQSTSGATATAPALAATPTTPSPPVLEEVVVTARKREERLQDVPLSISAVTAEEVAARGVTNLENLQYSIPGLSVSAFGPGQENIQIRGVAAILGRPTTGLYLNELSISGDDANNVLHVSLLDMQRIEVLRGPQATLYGEGSMGGTIRYITTPPDLSSYSGQLEAEGGQVYRGGGSYRGALIANLPLVTDKLGLRLVGGYERDGGWIDNTYFGLSNVNGLATTTVRGELRARPIEGAELSILYAHQENRQNYSNFAIDHTSTATVPTYYRDTYNLVTATLQYDLGGVVLVEAPGYIDHNTQEQFDFTPYLQPILVAALGVPPSFAAQIFNPETEWTRSFSNELRIASRGSSKLKWTVGTFYRSSKMDQTSEATTAPGTFPFELLNLPANLKSSSYSAYAEGEYQLTSSLNFLAGLRYYHDSERIYANQVSFGVPAVTAGEQSFHSTNPRFNIRYRFSADAMMYLNAAEGFRSGGFNVGTPPGPQTFAPDHIWTYEIGTKQQLFDRKMEFDGAVYYSNWTDVQSAFFPPGTAGIVVTENAGRAAGWGTDLSVAVRPLDGLTLTATYGWNNLEFKTNTADKKVGDPVDYAPSKSASASIEYRRPIAGKSAGFVRADYQYVGQAQVTIRDFDEIVPLPSRSTVNLRTGVDLGSLEISVFGTNVFNDSKSIQIGPYAAVAQNLEQQPRTVGVTLRAHF